VVRLTAKERVLLHLLDYAKHAEAIEVPLELTQEGIARAAGFDLAHFAEYVRPLVEEHTLKERMAHVKGIRQRRKVYDLTESGRMESVRLREKVREEVVRVRTGNETREATVAQVLAEWKGKVSILSIVRQVAELGVVEPDRLAAPAGLALVCMLSEAPIVEDFVGRREELAALTNETETPRVFVVRGVAGIGKSSLASKACDVLRGKRNLLWRRVRPWDTPQSVLASVGDFLATLGKPGLQAVLTRGEAHRAPEVLASDLPGTRAMLVFDDVHEAKSEVVAALRLLKEAVARAADVRLIVLSQRTVDFYDRRDVALGGLVREIDLGGLSPEDATALLSSGGLGSEAVELGRQVGGHPLFLALLRARSSQPREALHDVKRFVAEAVYGKLSDQERRLMKTASLYEVPVPIETLLSDSTFSQDLVLGLVDRSLMRRVGEDQLGVQDAVRGVFVSFLTAAERDEFGKVAAGQLRELASQAWEAGDAVRTIDYVSNALHLVVSPQDRAFLLELKGDATDRIGELKDAMAAYREALKSTTDRETAVRMHRKMAWALAKRQELGSAIEEVDAGLEALGAGVSVERGWLDLVRARVAALYQEMEEAREHGTAALQTFRGFDEVRGQADALSHLSWIEFDRPGGDISLALSYSTEALELSRRLIDPELMALIRIRMAWYHAVGLGEFETSLRLLASVDATAGTEASIRAHMCRAAVHRRRAEYAAAKGEYDEAIDIARKAYDAVYILNVKGMLTILDREEGRFEGGREAWERLADEYRARRWPFMVLSCLGDAAEAALLEGDIEGFRRLVAELEDPGLSQGMQVERAYVLVLQGIDRLILGDWDSSQQAFEESLRLPHRWRNHGEFLPHFFYGIALRIMGNEREAQVHLGRFRDLVETTEAKGLLTHFPEKRVTGILRAACRTPNRTSA